MFQNKKAVSPIIAAVLLVVITIAIGATTMAFIRSLADSNLESAQAQATRIACGSDVDLEIPVVNNSYKICYYDTTGAVKVLLHNKGSIRVKGFSFHVIQTNGSVDTTQETLSIDKNAYLQINFTPSTPINSTDIDQWRIEPKIQGAPGKGDTVCADVAIVRDLEDIDVCT